MKRLVLLAAFCGVLCGLAWAGHAQDTGGGTVTGSIQVQQARVKTGGPKSFKDVVVHLKPVGAHTYPSPTTHAVMDQRGLVFLPHVMAVQSGTTIDFLNSDHDRHNVYFLFEETGQTLDIGTWGPGQRVSHTFARPGLVITLCQLHLEMAAYILVLESPFFTLAELDEKTQQAAYAISGVPPGDYILEAWHKKLKMKGAAPTVTVAAGRPTTADIVITRKKYAK